MTWECCKIVAKSTAKNEFASSVGSKHLENKEKREREKIPIAWCTS